MPIDCDKIVPYNINMKKKLGLYIHIPFCEKKCNYCSFLSFDSLNIEERNNYVELLCREIGNYKNQYSKLYYIDTIFIGGGTPSLLEGHEIINIVSAVRNTFEVSSEAEITIESNPNSLNEKKMLAYKEIGINRLSIGVQSLDDKMLKSLGRIHTKKEFLNDFNLARKVGFKNINIDLMFGFPKQTMSIWKTTLKEILILMPEHISFYSLQLEKGTSFYESYRCGDIDLVSDKIDRNMYHYAINLFKNKSYEHYEISNAALPRYECKHNLKYWQLDEFLGCGLGAHSYINKSRVANVTSIKDYATLVKDNQLPVDLSNYKKENSKESMAIYVFTSLRKSSGIDLMDFKMRFGREFTEAYKEKFELILEYKKTGLMVETKNHLALTELGIDSSNDIMSEFV